MSTTPIYVSVLRDLKWDPDAMAPPLDLDAMVAASYDRPRHDPPPEQASPHTAARGRGRSPRTPASSTKKRAPRRTTTKKPTGDADA